MKLSRLISWIDRRSYAQKFSLVGLLFVLALTGFFPMGRDQLLRREQYGVKELEGTLYLRPLQPLLADINTYHLWAVRHFNDQNVSDQLLLQAAIVENNLAEMQRLHDTYGESLLLTDEQDKILETWAVMQAAVALKQSDRLEETHEQLNQQIRQLINRVGDTSFLILDPDLDTYYMMDASLLKLPELQELLNEITHITIHAAVENEFETEDRLALVSLMDQIRFVLAELQDGMQTSWQNDATGVMRTFTEVYLQALTAQTEEYLALIEAQFVLPDEINPQPNVFQLQDAVNAHLITYYEGTSASLEFGINNRIQAFTNRLTYAFAIAFVSIALALGIGLLLFYRISRPLNELMRAAARLGAGEFGVRVPVTGEDEASQVGHAFNQMAAELQASQAQLTAQVNALAQLTKALEASANISRQLSTILEYDALVIEIVQSLKQTFGYYHAHIYVLDSQNETLVLAGGTGDAGRAMLAARHHIPLSKGLVGRAARTRQIVYVPDVTGDAAWLPNALLPDTRSEAAVPILFGQELMGVLDVHQSFVEGLSASDLTLLQSIAAQVAVALRNARIFNQAKNQAKREAVINSVTQRIQAATDVHAVLEIAAQTLGQALSARRVDVQIGGLGQNGQANHSRK